MIGQILFPPGQVVATQGALGLGINLLPYLVRHLTGDWGDLGDFDRQQNDLALREGDRIFSAYETQAGRLWIITEWDRSATTFLLPDEY